MAQRDGCEQASDYGDLVAILSDPGFAEGVMGILSWLVLGGVAGWIANLLVNRSGEGLMLDILLGIAGALIGGWGFSALGWTGVTGFNLWSVFVAVVGAIVVLALYHALVRR